MSCRKILEHSGVFVVVNNELQIIEACIFHYLSVANVFQFFCVNVFTHI